MRLAVVEGSPVSAIAVALNRTQNSVRGKMIANGVFAPRAPSEGFASVVGEVAGRHRMPVAVVLGQSRRKAIVRARQEAMWEVRQRTNMSLPAIGRRFGRDHTTALHGIRQHAARLAATTPAKPLPDLQDERTVSA